MAMDGKLLARARARLAERRAEHAALRQTRQAEVYAAAPEIRRIDAALRALVGGRSYQVQRGFNRATQLRRQPGSALKPLAVYAPAIDQFADLARR